VIHVSWILKDSNIGGVDDSIRMMTLDILISVLKRSYAKDDDQGEEN
jgi:hypothetical protein